MVWQERVSVIVDLEENKVSEYKKNDNEMYIEACYIITTLTGHQGPWLNIKNIRKSNVTNVITFAVISMINPTNFSVI